MSRPLDDDFDYKTEVKKCKTIDDVMGKNGLIVSASENSVF